MTKQLANGKLLLDRPGEAVLRLTINNPNKRNALDLEMLDGICEACAELDEGIENRCLLMTGTQRMFSAGYDITGARQTFSADHDASGAPIETFAEQAERLVAHPFHAAIEAIESVPYPTVAAINGHALGGGLELAISCDLRVAARGVKLGMPPAKLGLIYSHTGLQKFIELIGPAYTKELFFTGDTITAERGYEIGVVNQVVDPESVEATSLELAQKLADNAPLSQKGNKRIIRSLTSFARMSQAEEEELVSLRRSCFETEDFWEGVQAFAEKRKPLWKGK